MDSTTAIFSLTDEEVITFWEIRGRNWRVEIEHTYREESHAVDYFASLGYDYPFGNHMILVTCINLVYFLRCDCISVVEPHLISVND
ncbi:hypothetical protein LINPERPRIM_LOCUS26271 [Linum perenne]